MAAERTSSTPYQRNWAVPIRCARGHPNAAGAKSLYSDSGVLESIQDSSPAKPAVPIGCPPIDTAIRNCDVHALPHRNRPYVDCLSRGGAGTSGVSSERIQTDEERSVSAQSQRFHFCASQVLLQFSMSHWSFWASDVSPVFGRIDRIRFRFPSCVHGR